LESKLLMLSALISSLLQTANRSLFNPKWVCPQSL
jgi:hypothetical protein